MKKACFEDVLKLVWVFKLVLTPALTLTLSLWRGDTNHVFYNSSGRMAIPATFTSIDAVGVESPLLGERVG
jgi:hypothetical protein